MGAINPEEPRPKKDLLTVSQEFARALFFSTSKFFEAQTLIEDAVISESIGESPNITAINDGCHAMKEASNSFEIALRIFTEYSEIINEVNDWQPEYYERMTTNLIKLHKISEKLCALLSRSEIIEETKRGNLQESLWHKNVNYEVRLVSMEYIRELINSLQYHLNIVVKTNEKA